MGFLVVAVFMLALVGLSEGFCNYTECIFAGLNRSSGVEYFVGRMNFDEFPSDAADQLAILRQRQLNCSSRRTGCSNELTEPFARRFYDPYYMKYIMDLGHAVSNALVKYQALGNCVTGSFKTTLQSYIVNMVYNASEIRQAITDQPSTSCTNDNKYYFRRLFNNRLVLNPYHVAAQQQG